MADRKHSEPPADLDRPAGSADEPDAAGPADEPDEPQTPDTSGATATSGEASRADEPAERIGEFDPDELDPELIALSPPRTGVGVVLCLSIIVFCVYIMSRLYADLQFSRQGAEPTRTTAAAIVAGEVEENAFVEVLAVPDRSFAVRVAKSKADYGSRIAPVQSTDGKLWLMLPGNTWTAEIKYDEVYTGRLRRVASLPFADDLASHVRGRPAQPRFATARAVRSALAESSASVLDPAGDPIAVTPETPVEIVETVANRARLLVFEDERDAQQWTAVLVERALIPAGASPERGDNAELYFTVNMPGGPEAVQRVLDSIKQEDPALFAASVEPVIVTHHTTWGALIATGRGESFEIEGAKIPWASTSWVALEVDRELPSGAWVVITGDNPETYWYVLILYIALAAFALLFAWALVRAIRGLSKT